MECSFVGDEGTWLMRVKTGKRILRVKGAQYTKVKVGGMKMGARNIQTWKQRKKKPPALRKPMAETVRRPVRGSQTY